MVIYRNELKTLEFKKSKGVYSFYLTRENNVFKIKKTSIAINHISRNLHGIHKIRAYFRVIVLTGLVYAGLD